jgi:lactoylglutathione lyase
LQQVALGNLAKQDLSKFWIDVMGLEKVKSFTSEKENVNEDVLKVGKGVLGTVEVDIMAPLDPEKSPKVHIPALNHIGLWIDDLELAVKQLEGEGIKVLGGIRPGASGHNVTFLHPKSCCGVLVELVQAPEEVVKAFDKQ